MSAGATAPKPAAPAAAPEVRLVNRRLPEAPPADVKLFAPEGSAEGCASGECLPGEQPATAKAPPAPSLPPEPPPELYDAEEPEPELAPAPRPAAAARATSASDDDRWRRAVDAVRQAAPRQGKSLTFARFLGFTPEGARLAFTSDAAFHRNQVLTGLSRTTVEAELSKALGRPIKLVEETNQQLLQAAPKSIAEVEAGDRAAREKQIEDKVRAHPALRNVLRHLGGSLEHITYLEPPQRPIVLASTDESDAGPPVD